MKLKQIFVLLIAMLVMSPMVAQARQMGVYVNGIYLVRDVQRVGDFDMLPILDIAGELGFDATFDGNVAILKNDKQQYRFTIGNPAVYDQDGKEYGLDIVPQIINGRLMIPAKFFQDAMGMSYFWDNVTDAVFLNSQHTYDWLVETPEYKEAKEQLTAPVTMYAKDGRTAQVSKNEVDAWKREGWYTEPFCYVYAMDGRVANIPESEVPAWVAAGWYDSAYITLYSNYQEEMSVHVWNASYWLKEGWSLEPFYEVYSKNGSKRYRYTKSEIERGAYYSLDDAIEIAENFCKTHMPVPEEDIYWYADECDVSVSEVRSWLYQGEFLDFNDKCYLIGVSVIDHFEAVSVNKYTGEVRYCGGGQDYARGWFDF